MLLKELSTVLNSRRGYIQFAIVYDSEKNIDIENGCSVDYAIEKYGEKTVKHIDAFENMIVIEL